MMQAMTTGVLQVQNAMTRCVVERAMVTLMRSWILTVYSRCAVQSGVGIAGRVAENTMVR